MGGTHQSPPTSSLLPCAGRSKRVALGGSSSLRSGAAARPPPWSLSTPIRRDVALGVQG